jgi:acylphosphatase
MSVPAPKSSELVAAEILVTGRVQGVYYRAFTQHAAVELGLSGWVRNVPDGRVHVMVEGPRTKVEKLVSRLRVGPPRAVVTDFSVTWKAATREAFGFTVLP